MIIELQNLEPVTIEQSVLAELVFMHDAFVHELRLLTNNPVAGSEWALTDYESSFREPFSVYLDSFLAANSEPEAEDQCPLLNTPKQDRFSTR